MKTPTGEHPMENTSHVIESIYESMQDAPVPIMEDLNASIDFTLHPPNKNGNKSPLLRLSYAPSAQHYREDHALLGIHLPASTRSSSANELDAFRYLEFERFMPRTCSFVTKLDAIDLLQNTYRFYLSGW